MLRDRIIVRLRVVCFLLFAGYAWSSANGQLPIVSRHPLFSSFQTGWYLVLAASCMLPLRWKLLLRICLFIGSLLIAWVSWMDWLASGKGIGQFLEHASRYFTPMVFFFVLGTKSGTGWTPAIDAFARRGLALTFFFHGLFAYGFISHIWILHHQTPSSYIFMVRNCLGIDSMITAAALLRAVGIVDFIVAIGLFIPFTRVPALLYMVVWGFLTALARPWAHFDSAAVLESLNRWIPEFLVRTPHYLLPLLLLWIWKQSNQEKPRETKSGTPATT